MLRRIGQQKGMQVVVDGVVYESQAHRGITRLYNAILPRMCDLEPALRIRLLTAAWVKKALPRHPQIQHRPLLPIDSILRPRRLWSRVLPDARAFVQRAQLGGRQTGIWHSTYYTVPLDWKGCVVTTVHDMAHERLPHLFGGVHNDLFRKRKEHSIRTADAVICVTDTTKNDLQDLYRLNTARVAVVPNGFNPIFRMLKNDHPSAPAVALGPYLLYVGMRDSYKNFTTLSRAYSQWDRRHDVRLLVVGRPWMDKEKQMLAELGITGRVHLLPDVKDAELCVLYNQAAAFVYPSLYEGFGIPLLEAMACGCPIAASRIPSTVEVAQSYPAYFDPTDVESLCAALDAAVTRDRDPALVRLGLEIAGQYSWDRTAAATLNIYRSLGT